MWNFPIRSLREFISISSCFPTTDGPAPYGFAIAAAKDRTVVCVAKSSLTSGAATVEGIDGIGITVA